jgi:hypothetical protein
MSSNKITTTSPIKSLEIKTKEENTKLFKDDVLDKFNFWIYVGFIILGLLLLFSFILLIYSLFSSSKSSNIQIPPVPINNIEKPVITRIPTPYIKNPIQEVPLKKPDVINEEKPSFFSSFFGKKKEIINQNPPKINIDSKPTFIPPTTTTPTTTNNTTTTTTPTTTTPPTTNNTTSYFSNFFSSLTNRTNIPKPLNTKGGKKIKIYKK